MITTNIFNEDVTLYRFKNAFHFTNKYWEAAKTAKDLTYIRTLLKVLTRVPCQSANVCIKRNVQYNDLPLHILTDCSCTTMQRELFMD